jgi:hypothetical protein
MEDQFGYRRWRIIFNELLALVQAACVVYLFVLSSNLGAYAITAAFFIIPFPFSYKNSRSFIRMINNKPAIEVTDLYFIDHLNGVRLLWSEIKKVDIIFYRYQFLAIELVDISVFLQQIKNPVYRSMLRVEAFLSRKAYKINLSLVANPDELLPKMRAKLNR